MAACCNASVIAVATLPGSDVAGQYEDSALHADSASAELQVSTLWVLEGYSRGTQQVLNGYSKGYSKGHSTGTNAVSRTYSRGTRGVLVAMYSRGSRAVLPRSPQEARSTADALRRTLSREVEHSADLQVRMCARVRACVRSLAHPVHSSVCLFVCSFG